MEVIRTFNYLAAMSAKDETGRRPLVCSVGVCVPTEGTASAGDRKRRPCQLCWFLEVTEVETNGWAKIIPDHLFIVLYDAYQQFIWELDNPDKDPRVDYRGGRSHWICLKRKELYTEGQEEHIKKQAAPKAEVNAEEIKVRADVPMA